MHCQLGIASSRDGRDLLRVENHKHPKYGVLYQFAGEGVLLFAVLWWYSSRPRARGAVSGLFLAGYAAARFAAEFAREPDAFLGILWFGLSMGQLLCIPMLAAGVYLMVRTGRG